MEARAFPIGWASCKLGDVVKLHYGKALPAKSRDPSGAFPVYGSNGCVGKHTKALAKGPCIVVGRKGTAGAVEFSKTDCWPIDTTYFVPSTEHADIRFLFYLLKSLRLDKLDRSTAIPGLNRDDAYALNICIAPFNEQRRIVEKIETLFAQLDKGEEALREVQKLLNLYRQSVLKAAFTGQLTADWRAENAQRLEHGRDLLARILKTRRENWIGRGKYKEPVEPNISGLPDLPAGWVWSSISQIADIKGGVTVDKKRQATDPIKLPYLRVANVQNGYLDLKEIKQITINRDKAEQYLLETGDILLNEGGDRDKLGRGWVWNGEVSPCIHQNHVYRARPVVPEISSTFISYYANAFGQPFFMQKGKQSVNLASISLTAISGLPIPLPSVDEQNEIVVAIEEKLEEIETISSACISELSRSAALRQSILKDAFAGRLVPQDPDDEPASELLARIRKTASAMKRKKQSEASA